MSSSGEVKAVEVRSPSDIDFVFPNGFSFFEPYLQYFIRETIGAGGEAYVSRTSEGNISGLFVYDGSEKTGTIYTRSKDRAIRCSTISFCNASFICVKFATSATA